MKRVFNISLCVCAFLIGMCTHVYAQKDGSTCYKAIPIGKDYTETITSAKTVWYTARTFDLPLAVYFIPKNETDPAPEVMMDFSCTSGIYSDPIICMLFCKGGTLTMPMPHKPQLDTTRIEGQLAYYISVGKSYRDLLLKFGIDYNVDVVIEVTYHSAGSMSIAPDGMFSTCVDMDKIVHLGDSIPVEANDKESYVIVPYVQWQYDSIQYVWSGTAPCILSIGNNCTFDPTSTTDDAIMDGGPNSPYNPLQPGGKWKVTSDLLRQYVNDTVNFPNEAGMYFAKFYSTAPGGIKISKLPTTPPRGNAVLMRYDRSYALSAYDPTIYAMPNSWKEDLQFTTPTKHMFSMIVANDPDFAEGHVLATYSFDPYVDGHLLGIFEKDIKELWKKAVDNYLYVRFVCSEATKVTPSQWKVSPCITKAKLITKGTEFTVARGANGKVFYRFYYSQWKGGDMKFQWKNTRTKCPLFLGDTCSYEYSNTDPHVILNADVPTNGTWTLTKERLDTLEKYVDGDGYLYLLFNPTAQAKMIISTDAPEETDPVYPTVTVTVACDETNKPYVEVSKAQTLTIKNEAGTTVKTIDAEPNAKNSLSALPSGQYTIQGETETITINL